MARGEWLLGMVGELLKNFRGFSDFPMIFHNSSPTSNESLDESRMSTIFQLFVFNLSNESMRKLVLTDSIIVRADSPTTNGMGGWRMTAGSSKAKDRSMTRIERHWFDFVSLEPSQWPTKKQQKK